MIRKFNETDIDTVMFIWLNSNLEAHNFIDPDYWKGCFDSVKMMISRTEVYVSEICGAVNGFIGITDNYINGLFVDKSAREEGIGSELLNYVKKDRSKLYLDVYKKNILAVKFYKNHGFKIVEEKSDFQTSETDYIMSWER